MKVDQFFLKDDNQRGGGQGRHPPFFFIRTEPRNISKQ